MRWSVPTSISLAAVLAGAWASFALEGRISADLARCFAHAFTFAGGTLWLGYKLSCMRPMTSAELRASTLAAAAFSAVCIALAQQVQLLSTAAVVFLAGAWVAALAGPLVLKNRILLQVARKPILAAALCAATISWSWELLHQPFFDVYGDEARGYVQWDQVLTDLAGICIGAAAAKALLLRNRPVPTDAG